MSSIDERIVNMKFNNSQFQKGVADTNKSLDDLKRGLNLDSAKAGLENLALSAKNFTLEGVSTGVQGLSGKFVALATIGITALANITNQALATGKAMLDSLTIAPIKAGFDEYELKMGSIQTILANTARHGTGLDQVKSSLEELNTYADKTIYNFGDMTKNIGLFTNAGIKLEDATSMIKGFSNEAAASGTNSMQAAGAAYQLSQALSAGTIRLMDWRSLSNVGMGNKNMQQGIADLATAMGAFEGKGTDAISVMKDFPGSLEKGWLSADVMSNYLKIMAGDMDEATQRSLGLSDAQIEAFAKQQSTAEDAATKVRTWTQLLGTMREAVGSSWSETFELILGDFDAATTFFTGINDTFGSILGAMGAARNDLVEGWADLGGRDKAIEGLYIALSALRGVITPVKEAFREIFPPITAQQLFNITQAVVEFSKTLIPTEATIANIKSTAKGFFAVLDIGWMVIKGFVGVLAQLLGAAAGGGSGFLGMTANIGDWLVSVRDAIKNGEVLGKVFGVIGDVLQKPIDLLKKLGSAITANLAVQDATSIWEKLGSALQKIGDFIAPAIEWIKMAVDTVKTALSNFAKDLDFNLLVGALNVGLFGGVFLLIKRFIDGIPDLFKGAGGIIDGIKGAFTGLTDTLESMQSKLKAEALKQIAIAIAILAAAVLVMSFIDGERLTSSVAGISALFVALMTSMTIMEKVVDSKGVAKMPIIAAGMILLSTALLIMTSALKSAAELEWDEIGRGLTALAGALIILAGAAQLLSKQTGSIISASVGITIISGALIILSSALKRFSAIEWDEIGRGLVAMGASLVVVAAFSKIVGSLKGLAIGSVGILLISGAMIVLASAVQRFGDMNLETVGKGLLAMAGALIVLSVAMAAIPVSALASAAVLLVVSGALIVIANAMKQFGSMSWEEIGKAMVILAGSLAVLAGAMALMGIPLVLLGSIGIIAAAGALTLLAPALVLLGTMSWQAVGVGLTVLAGALTLLAVAGLVITPAVPGLLGLAAAIALIGVGAGAAALGVGTFVAAFAAFATVGPAGAKAIEESLLVLIGLIPKAMIAFAQGIIDFALVIATGASEFTKAMTTLLLSLIDAVHQLAPQIVNTIYSLVDQLVQKLVEGVPRFADAGLRLLAGLLNAVARNMWQVITAGTNIVLEFLRGIRENFPRLAQAGAETIISFVQSLTNAINTNASRMRSAGRDLAFAIVDGMTGGLLSGASKVITEAKNMAVNALNAAKKALGINSPSKEFFKVGAWSDEGIIDGLQSLAGKVASTASNVGKGALNAVKKSMSNVGSAVGSEMDMTPVIRPVLDLSGIKKDASGINDMLTPSNVAFTRAYEAAASAANGYTETREAITEAAQSTVVTTKNDYIFTQNNTSPKALNAGELYRQTKNQIALLKDAEKSNV